MNNTQTLAVSKPLYKPPYFNRHYVNENIKFLRRSLAYNLKPILIHEETNRGQLRGFSRTFKKTGECHLYAFQLNKEYDADIITKELSRMKNARKLTLELRGSKNLSDTGVEALAAALRQMKYLRSLKLIITGGESIYDPAMRSLIRSIATCNLLETLELQFLICFYMGDEAFLDIESLKSLTCLKNFTLNLDFCTNLTDASFKRLADLVGGLKRLESFSLSVQGRNAQDNDGTMQAISDLVDNLSRASNLKTVTLSMRGWKCPSPKEELLAESLAKLKNIRSLTLLPARGDVMTDAVLEQTCTAIAEITALRHLEIDFQECTEVNDMKAVANMLEKLKELRFINFNFNGLYGLTNDNITLIGEKIGKLGLLRSVNLNLKVCRGIRDEGIDVLIQGIGQNSDLESLELRFAEQRFLSKVTMISIQKHITVLKKLTTLVVGFEQCLYVEDSSIVPLCEGLESMTNLKSAFINFTNCEEICSTGVVSLCQGLKKLVNLEELTVYVRNCAKITNEPIHQLSKVLSNMPMLRKLSIVFHFASHVDDEGIEELCGAISNLSLLTGLTLDFSWAWIITPKSLDIIKKMLMKARRIEYCELAFGHCDKIARESDEGLRESLKKNSRISLVSHAP